MKTLIYSLLVSFLMFDFGCKTSTQSDNSVAASDKNVPVPTLTITTDSLIYVRSSGSTRVLFQIHNATDSTMVFPSCPQIRCRIDTMRTNNWSEGVPTWDLPCLDVYSPYTLVKSDSVYVGNVIISSPGTFRIVSICGSYNSYPDTVLSNNFTVK